MPGPRDETVERLLDVAAERWEAEEGERALAAVVQAVEAARTVGPMSLQRALLARLQIELALGRIDEAMGTAHELMATLRRLDDVRYLANGASQVAEWFDQADAVDVAKALYAEAIAAVEEAGDVENAAALSNNLGLLLARRGDTDGAIAAFEAAVGRYRSLGEPAVPNVIKALENLVALHHQRLDRTARRRCLEEIWSLVRHRSGPIGHRLQLLGNILSAQVETRDRAAARDTAQELEAMLVAVHAELPDGPALARVLLAATLREAGLFADSATRLREALGQLSPGSIGWMTAANNLAQVLADMGELGEARRRLEEVVEHATASGDAKMIAVAHRNRAVFLRNIGDRVGAIADARVAVAHQREVVSREPSNDDVVEDLAATLHNLGLVLLDDGRYEEAAQAIDEANRLSPREARELTVEELRNRGYAALELRRPHEAEALLVMAEGKAFKERGASHPLTAACAIDLSTLALFRGRPEDARNTARRALRILDESSPGLCFDRARALGCLARAQALLGDHDEALDTAERMEEVNDQLMSRLFAAAPDRQRTSFATRLREDFETFLSVWLSAPPTPQRTAMALERVLRRKGLGVEAFALQRERTAEDLDELRALRRRAAVAILESGSASDGGDWVRRIEALEAELAGQTKGPSLAEHLDEVTVARVAQALPPDHALLELVRALVTDHRQATTDARPPSSARYLAFVLRGSGSCTFVDLGPAEPIDEVVGSIVDAAASTIVRDLAPVDTGATAGIDGHLHRLGLLVWQPLIDAIGDCTTVLVAPDGALSLVPLDLVPAPGGGWALDERCFVWLTSGRDVLRWGAKPRVSSAPLVLGGPRFDRTGASALRRGKPTGALATLVAFDTLPGAHAEAVDVARLLGVEAITGDAATKAVVLASRGPMALHLATHGFVLPGSRGGAAVRWSPEGGGADNPMLRTGLALAGANAWLASGDAPADVGNGILTAEEIAALDLGGTELVVLSACKTGSGVVDVAEGVYGLRRAVALAGASRLVVSCWRIPDEATRELMVAFYENLLQGLGCAEALRRARLGIRDRHPHGAAVACGFILVGNPAPIEHLREAARA